MTHRRLLEVQELTLWGGTPCVLLGDGPRLVVFRSAVPSSANPRGLERWAELRLLRPLARRFTVDAFGRRPGLKRGVTMAELAAHHAEEVTRQFSGPVHVLGMPTAGRVAQQFAADDPALVNRLVLAATACRLGEQGRALQRQCLELVAAGRYRAAGAVLMKGMFTSPVARRLAAAAASLTVGRPETLTAWWPCFRRRMASTCAIGWATSPRPGHTLAGATTRARKGA